MTAYQWQLPSPLPLSYLLFASPRIRHSENFEAPTMTARTAPLRQLRPKKSWPNAAHVPRSPFGELSTTGLSLRSVLCSQSGQFGAH